MADKPYRLGGGGSAGIVRGDKGRFQLEDPNRAGPVNPLDEEDEGRQPSDWAPGIGQCTDPMTGPSVPWPEAGPATGSKPMKLG